MSKLINISNEVYEKLTKMKGKESYTIVIWDLLSKKGNKEQILALAGKADFDEEKLKNLKKGWKKWSEKYA